jgi:predicted esterase
MRQPPPLSESVFEAIGNVPTIAGRLLVMILAFLLACPTDTKAAEFDETVRTARQYLACSDQEQRAALSRTLAEFTGDWRDVVKALRPRPTQTVKPGYYRQEHFTDPQLRQKHPHDLLYLVVPTGYQPDQPTGLVVFMHGGGKGSPRTAPDRYMTPADSTMPRSSTRLGDMFETLGMIGVGPSAPWNENDHSRWCLPETDDYIADVVRECATRFHIDLDRVFLLGHSMGGFGAYHQVQRQPDRFAAVIASAGSWTLAQWPVIRGTTLCIVHGTKDAELGVRDRHTDIAFARYAHELLSQRNIPYVYKEHPDGHSFGYGKQCAVDFLKNSRNLRRDPFFRHVVLASPVGYASGKCYPVRHNRWITLDAASEAPLKYDALQRQGPGHSKDSSAEEWKQWRLTHTSVKQNGAMIEAINLGENRLKVTVTNVSRCTLWLHSAMVDFEKPIQVTINGEPCFDALVTPSLVTALESFERRRDWGLVYPAKITLDTNGNGSARLPDDVPLDGTAFEEHVGPTFSQTSRDYR